MKDTYLLYGDHQSIDLPDTSLSTTFHHVSPEHDTSGALRQFDYWPKTRVTTWSKKPIPVEMLMVCALADPGVQSRSMEISIWVSLVFLEIVAVLAIVEQISDH
jgi:hypothetical protein